MNPAGNDGILGYMLANGDGEKDDNFQVFRNSLAIDRGDSWVGPGTDILGIPRVDDPGTPNAGSPDYLETDLGSSFFTEIGT